MATVAINGDLLDELHAYSSAQAFWLLLKKTVDEAMQEISIFGDVAIYGWQLHARKALARLDEAIERVARAGIRFDESIGEILCTH